MIRRRTGRRLRSRRENGASGVCARPGAIILPLIPVLGIVALATGHYESGLAVLAVTGVVLILSLLGWLTHRRSRP
jgi:hypothetical protein